MNKIKKITVLGAGNASCITSLSLFLHGKILTNFIDEIEICYDPSIPIEKVGQGTTISVAEVIGKVLNISLYEKNNPINATLKDGILYKNWKDKEEILHPFPINTKSIHYVPHLLSKEVLNSGLFSVVEKNIVDPESEIDSDFIFDCRGKSHRNIENYLPLTNPLNSVLLSRKDGRDINITNTECIATPDGWTFVIPNQDSVSYGYLYNDTITKDSIAKENLLDLFGLEIQSQLKFENYVAKSMWYGERTILNGNMFSFLEPLEATSMETYLTVARNAWAYFIGRGSKSQCDSFVLNYVKNVENFILWHYQNGSKYNTPFWEYAKSLTFNPDEKFKQFLEMSRQFSFNQLAFYNDRPYAQWTPYSFKAWEL